MICLSIKNKVINKTIFNIQQNINLLNKVILKELFRTFLITDDIFSVPLHQYQQVVIQIRITPKKENIE